MVLKKTKNIKVGQGIEKKAYDELTTFWIFLLSLFIAIIFGIEIHLLAIPLILVDSYIIYILERKIKTVRTSEKAENHFIALPFFIFLLFFFHLLISRWFFAFLAIAIASLTLSRILKRIPVESIQAAFLIYFIYLLLSIEGVIEAILIHSLFLLLIKRIKSSESLKSKFKTIKRDLFKKERIINAVLILAIALPLLYIWKSFPTSFVFFISAAIFTKEAKDTIQENVRNKDTKGKSKRRVEEA
ncbi:MAG: hypothetical protein PWR30_237 [Candidatus Woesearchaeota archaeon]|nr:hypothetical protein [Candidatus Woesearchaeota archaeon]